jgi:ferrous iron transport protein B
MWKEAVMDKTEKSSSQAHSKVEAGLEKIAIVGNPNVGKSVMFNNLTGVYVIVSNYPATTVEVSRGKVTIAGTEFEVVDTPGMYSLLPITEEEQVARVILLQERPKVVMHMIDAKNIERMLPFTLQLIEAGLPTVLVLNMMDEAERVGRKIDIERLEKELGIPVMGTVSTTGEGVDRLMARLGKYINGETEQYAKQAVVTFPFENALEQITELLDDEYVLSRRTIGLLLLQEDSEVETIVAKKNPETRTQIKLICNDTQGKHAHPLEYIIGMQRQHAVGEILKKVTGPVKPGKVTLREFLSRLTMNPITGIPILLVVLYFGFYKFVGEFGSGTLVDFLESVVFEKHINPFLIRIFTALIPWAAVQDLFVGEYGMLTLGIRYAVAIILPIVTVFFVVFSVIEDSGYLPRLAMLIDRIFKKIGLSDRAVIPMVLGFGCATMATMVTRTLPTKRERVISTMLLALAIPCSAQLGVILALLQERMLGTFIWAGVFLFIGFLTAQIMPGDKPSFYMEVPPLRLPKLSNVIVKTYTRVQWYLKEVLPLFILASGLIWLGQVTGLFDICIKLLETPVKLIGLPDKAAKVFLLGFFRRDYGAAGLYDLNKTGILTGVQLVVSCVALTLFLPCVAQLLMNIKERGIKTGIAISFFVLFLSFTVAFLLNLVLVGLEVTL